MGQGRDQGAVADGDLEEHRWRPEATRGWGQGSSASLEERTPAANLRGLEARGKGRQGAFYPFPLKADVGKFG